MSGFLLSSHLHISVKVIRNVLPKNKTTTDKLVNQTTRSELKGIGCMLVSRANHAHSLFPSKNNLSARTSELIPWKARLARCNAEGGAASAVNEVQAVDAEIQDPSSLPTGPRKAGTKSRPKTDWRRRQSRPEGVSRGGVGKKKEGPRKSLAAEGGVELVFEDEDLAVVWKLGGVPLTQTEQSAGGGNRRGFKQSVEAWARSHLSLPQAEVATPLRRPQSGLVCVGKTSRAVLAFRESIASYGASAVIEYEYSVVVQGSVSNEVSLLSLLSPLCLNLSLDLSSPSASFGSLSLLRLRLPASASPSFLLSALSQAGHPVIGDLSQTSFEQDQHIKTRKPPVPGGTQLALVGVKAPAGGLWVGSSELNVIHEVPRKYAKLMKREELHFMRQMESSEDSDATYLAPFGPIQLTVSREGLKPRESSMALVHAAMREVNVLSEILFPDEPVRVLDICCGSGCLLLAILRLLPQCGGVGIDLDEEALGLATLNSESVLGELSSERRSHFLSADFSKLHEDDCIKELGQKGPFQVVVCNPPFLSEKANRGRVTDEDEGSLVGGKTGFEAYVAICASLRQCTPPLLAEDGLVIFQIPGGKHAAEKASRICMREGFEVVEVYEDSRGIKRCLLLRQT
mmetsp:Transcript_25130/g.34630  ORF Transcript_25130/g.34630 Transcript_25130/m.34630 type:complete len:628 (-) Transcript_25130:218-2101(-)|eukprot:CAMPEP_0196576498 /NCGR_PEP_ID=MMETSP1081-20130531/5737_1 /TAXON_ID=36882 /ORGANISM="Pyramimonas amylifera, Strain CCMP720" /LENGTH=627 /DNA_ID=CAMNT_0041895113 /DNA_START=313 /DNA_END=2196 /DNA_ORIENTATION=-